MIARTSNNHDALSSLLSTLFEHDNTFDLFSEYPSKQEQPDFCESAEMDLTPLKLEPLHTMSLPNSSNKTLAPKIITTTTTQSSLQDYDVICGRSKSSFNHVGNRRFRVTISMFLGRYFDSPSRLDRSMLIYEIIDTIHEAGGKFLKESQSGEWVELSQKERRNKVGHALRDAASTYRRKGKN